MLTHPVPAEQKWPAAAPAPGAAGQYHKGALLFCQVPTLRAYATLGVTMSRLAGRAGVEG